MYKATANILGHTQVTVEGEGVMDIIKQLGFFQTLPRECPICSAPLAFFDYPATLRDHSKVRYYGLRCSNTEEAHSLNFGEYKDKSGLFYKGDDKWAKCLVGLNREDDDRGDYAGPANSSQTHAGASSDPVAAGKLLFENGKVSKTENGYKVGSFEVVRENNMPVCRPPCPDFKNTQKCAHVEAALAFKKANDF